MLITGGVGLNLGDDLIHRGSIISVDCVIHGDIWAWPLVSVVHLGRRMLQAVVFQTQTEIQSYFFYSMYVCIH